MGFYVQYNEFRYHLFISSTTNCLPGNNNIPAQTLEEALFSSDQLKSAYQQLLSGMKVFLYCSNSRTT